MQVFLLAQRGVRRNDGHSCGVKGAGEQRPQSAPTCTFFQVPWQPGPQTPADALAQYYVAHSARSAPFRGHGSPTAQGLTHECEDASGAARWADCWVCLQILAYIVKTTACVSIAWHHLRNHLIAHNPFCIQ